MVRCAPWVFSACEKSPLRCSGDGQRIDDGERVDGSPGLVREKVEELVFLDGAAHGGAPGMLAGQVQPLRGAVGHGVEHGIASQVVRGAMEAVGARLHLHAEHAAGAVAELGVHGILLEVDLLHGVHGRRIAGFLRHHGWRAVQHDVVLRAGAAAHVQLRSRPVMKRILLRGGADHHRGIQGGEQERIAVDDRQLVGHLGVERQPHGRGVELHRDR